MHRFLRAIGYSKIKEHKEMDRIIMDVITNATSRNYTSNSETTLLAEFRKDYADGMGIAVVGEFNEDDRFTYEYSYPYLSGSGVSSEEDISVERHADKESYAGVCDDLRVGVSLVFYLQNIIDYVKIQYANLLPIRGTSLNLAALSTSGKIVLPLNKDEKEKEQLHRDSQNRNKLIAQARKGNEEAIETLTLEDMDIYNKISKEIRKTDMLSLLDTYFMPCGVECEQYAILGEILECRMVKNVMTEEEIYILKICCNELTFDLAINKIDLYGEPKVGRRFKGAIWMQGKINFPDVFGVSS